MNSLKDVQALPSLQVFVFRYGSYNGKRVDMGSSAFLDRQACEYQASKQKTAGQTWESWELPAFRVGTGLCAITLNENMGGRTREVTYLLPLDTRTRVQIAEVDFSQDMTPETMRFLSDKLSPSERGQLLAVGSGDSEQENKSE